jgi:Protein of unknown function (DUF3253)
MTGQDSKPLSIEDSILDILARPDTKTLGPTEIAHAIANNSDWHDLLAPIRKAAVALAQNGRLVIYRKGKPVDPNDFRGVYRLGLPRHD